MTIPETSSACYSGLEQWQRGDVFILDMGEPVKIVDLAKNLIQLSGLSVKDENNPKGDIEITYTGVASRREAV